MEVLASADEAMPALAERLAGMPPGPPPPAVPSHASAPLQPSSSPMQPAAGELQPTPAAIAGRPAGGPPHTSAPAVLSHASTPSSRPEEPAAAESHPVSAPAAAPRNGHAPTSEHPAVSMQIEGCACVDDKPEEEAGVAAASRSTAADEASPRQASTPKPGNGLRTRPMSSAALSESPAALAMPAREELAQD